MKKQYLPIITILCLISILVVSFSYSASANALTATNTANNQGQALEIAPPVINLSANPGQTIKAKISLRDISNNKLTVSNQIDDFVADGENGTPKLLIDSKEVNPYSLKNWINSIDQLTLSPKQIKDIPINIKVPANASPGGYYGVIRFSGKAPELTDTGVSLSASLGALVMIRVNGAVTEKMSLVEFGTTQYGKTNTIFEDTSEAGPITFFERVKNEGNIHEQPSGQVSITDMFGKVIAAANVNMPPKNVLPDSIRRFEQPINEQVLGTRKLFGKYTANLKISYGENKQSFTKTITFWVIPYKLIAVLIVAIIVALTVIIFLIKRYNKFIINKAQGKTKTKKVKKIKK